MGQRNELHPDVMALLAIVPAPSHPLGVASERLWRKAEASAGVEYPVELKQINEVYGSGFFNGFVWVLNPAPQVEGYNLFTYGFDEDAAEIASDDIRPVLPTVTPEALLTIAWTRNGDEFFLITNSQPPWKLVLLGTRGSGVEVFDLTLPGLLVGVLLGRVGSEILGAKLNRGSPSFESA